MTGGFLQEKSLEVVQYRVGKSGYQDVSSYDETRYKGAANEYKQQVIEEQRLEIEKLQNEINQRSAAMVDLKEQLTQCAQHTEGHRQLINKLLNDIEHFQNDIEWYKRTYERRSFWGVLKEKLTKKK